MPSVASELGKNLKLAEIVGARLCKHPGARLSVPSKCETQNTMMRSEMWCKAVEDVSALAKARKEQQHIALPSPIQVVQA